MILPIMIWLGFKKNTSSNQGIESNLGLNLVVKVMSF